MLPRCQIDSLLVELTSEFHGRSHPLAKRGHAPPPIIWEKIFLTLFCVFYVLSCHLFAFYKF